MKKKYFGYKIIQTLPVGNEVFYIGYKKNDRLEYATYFKRNGSMNFAWVRFFNDLYSAQKDIVERAHRNIPIIDFSIEKEAENNVNETKTDQEQGYGKTARCRLHERKRIGSP